MVRNIVGTSAPCIHIILKMKFKPSILFMVYNFLQTCNQNMRKCSVENSFLYFLLAGLFAPTLLKSTDQ